MAIEIKVPPMGESISEATVAGWRKQPGEAVKAGEILVELETDKVTMEVPSPAAGILKEVRRQTGETVKLDDVLATMEEGGAASVPARPQTPTAASAEQSPSAPSTATAASSATAGTPAGKNDALPPGARRLASEERVDLAQVQGTGKRQQVTKPDIVDHLDRRSVTPSPSGTAATAPVRRGGEEVVPMSRLRQRIAERLVDAQHSAAILTTFNEVDMSATMDMRSRYKDIFEKKHGVKLGFMSFFVKACVEALQDYPAVNAEIRGTDLIYKRFYDIGVAVGGPRGLVVPIVRGCDQLSMADIEKEIARLGQKVKDGSITLDDMSGGTFTISNGGIYGSMMSTPILNPPQSGILGMHNIVKRAVVVNDQIVIRPMMYLALSYDHRVIDGKEAVSFLVKVKECIENPERMLLDV